jgi:hypothetical protein
MPPLRTCSLLWVRVRDGVDFDAETLRRVIPHGCICRHVGAQVVENSGDTSDAMPTVPITWLQHEGRGGVDVNWLRSKGHVLTADVTELVAFALLKDGDGAGKDYLCTPQQAETARDRLLQGEVIIKGGPAEAMKLHKKYDKGAVKRATLPPVRDSSSLCNCTMHPIH